MIVSESTFSVLNPRKLSVGMPVANCLAMLPRIVRAVRDN